MIEELPSNAPHEAFGRFVLPRALESRSFGVDPESRGRASHLGSKDRVAFEYDIGANLYSAADSLVATGECASLPELLENRLYEFIYDSQDRVDDMTIHHLPGATGPVLGLQYDTFGNRAALKTVDATSSIDHAWR